MFLFHLSLEHDLEGQPAQEEHQLGQGDERKSAEHGEPASDCACGKDVSNRLKAHKINPKCTFNKYLWMKIL